MQQILPFGPLQNRAFLSNHWLDHRLPLEPEWKAFESLAQDAAAKLKVLWDEQRDRVKIYGDEASLETEFIQPVFKILGWHLKYQPHLNGRDPDYALYTSDENKEISLKQGRKADKFWDNVAIVADAKAWHISLDKPVKTLSKREFPPEQIEWYVDKSRCDYGILTNGKFWRLVPRDIARNRPRFGTYLEVNLPELIDEVFKDSGALGLELHGEKLDLFKRFFCLFSSYAYVDTPGKTSLIKKAVTGSSEHAFGIGEELKERVFVALKYAVEGFTKYTTNSIDPNTDLSLCFDNSLVLLFRLLFILYAEDRGYLPLNKNDNYTKNRSLSRFRDDIAVMIDSMSGNIMNSYKPDSTALWKELKFLFDLVDSGSPRHEVPHYNGGLFSPEGHPFLESKAIPDAYVALIIDQLSRAPHPTSPELGLFRLDYRDLAIQQLGGVYESLLELHPKLASEEMMVVRLGGSERDVEIIIPANSITLPEGARPTGEKYHKGEIYLQTDKGERRAFGTYYTPDQIVNHIVNSTIGAKCRELTENITNELTLFESSTKEANSEDVELITSKKKAISESFGEKVLGLKILDPAMGSGHFLIRVCQYLAEEIITNPYSSGDNVTSESGAGTSLLYWKRRVAENCLFGVDINPMAVELAKLAVWLETVAIDAPLAFLDHHLQSGDSIIGARLKYLDTLPGRQLIDGDFKAEIEANLPSLVDPLKEIHNLKTNSIEDVKKKEQLFTKRFVASRSRFIKVADVWCAIATKSYLGTIGINGYKEVIATLIKGKNTSKEGASIVEQCSVALAAKGVVPFHWELAFPEVFLATQGETSGFDIILGNPPYDVISAKESGDRVIQMKNYIGFDQSLNPSSVGKNNLYKLFICRSIELLKNHGSMGFIVPMPLLGDDQASGIRKLLLSTGNFVEIHSFPQKDIPSKRVFRDAKLSTAIFIFNKNEEGDLELLFTSTRHPEDQILPNSPSLVLKKSDIPLYDPSNLAIVSCAQRDWDLAVKIPTQKHIGRLGDLCVSYQGEVNESSDSNFLSSSNRQGMATILRGSNISQYVVREASQGELRYIDVENFIKAKPRSEKVHHLKLDRIGFQRSSPQNNYRRVIAAFIPAGLPCFDTVSYIPTSSMTRLDLNFILALLNSTIIDWYFTIGSTNSKVNEYQFNNLPCPIFQPWNKKRDDSDWNKIQTIIESKPQEIIPLLNGLIEPFEGSPIIERTISRLAELIRAAEVKRGVITRMERSSLSGESQIYKNVIDEILFRLFGINSADADYIKTSLDAMV